MFCRYRHKKTKKNDKLLLIVVLEITSWQILNPFKILQLVSNTFKIIYRRRKNASKNYNDKIIHPYLKNKHQNLQLLAKVAEKEVGIKRS